MPDVVVELQLDQLLVGKLRESNAGQLRKLSLRSSVHQFVNATRTAMNSVVLMALADVRPIQSVHRAVGTRLQFDAAKPFVFGSKQIWFVRSGIAVALSNKVIAVHSPTVKVKRVSFVAKCLRPVRALINHEATVRVATARSIGSA